MLRNLFISAVMLGLVSCGKRVEYVENKYNDSNILAQMRLHEARIKSLETRVSEINQDLLDEIDSYLNSLEDRLYNEIPSVVPICDTNEVLFKFYDGYYALFMLSNNMESYISKLNKEVTYQTTDSVKRKFKINVDNSIDCSMM